MSLQDAMPALKVFTTCPSAKPGESSEWLRRLMDIARWSEAAGCEGILVFSDNRQIDPWLVSQEIIRVTERLCPLVAVQPAYMHPFTVAKMISSLGYMHGRRVYLNMVAGGFKNDLESLNDPTPHDERYARLVEYTHIIKRLVSDSGPVSHEGRYYRVNNLKLIPALPAGLAPGLMVSGSSEAGQNAARALDAVAIEYPRPSAEYAGKPRVGTPRGIRIGIITRADAEEAWRVALARYPEDRKGQVARGLANKVSDSQWHHQLSLQRARHEDDDPYWLVPFQNYKAMCPFLVGSHERVAAEIARYVDCGYDTFILDEPDSCLEIQHIGTVFARAASCARVAA